MKKKGYIAGSLFNEAEVSQRLLEGDLLREFTGTKIDWYNPIEQPCNEKSDLPTAMDIFKADTEAVIEADYIVADMTNNDTGVAMELGIAYGLQYAKAILDEMFRNADPELRQQINYLANKHGIKNKNIYAVYSDIRMANAGEYNGVKVPYGTNQYVVGGLECMNGYFANTFKDALDELVSDLKYEQMDMFIALDDYFDDYEDEETWQLTIED